jgi:hypothetical protein
LLSPSRQGSGGGDPTFGVPPGWPPGPDVLRRTGKLYMDEGFGRRVLGHRVAITMAADFRIAAAEDVLANPGPPDSFNPIRAANSPAPRSPACCAKAHKTARAAR